jgi:hypothetical protein
VRPNSWQIGIAVIAAPSNITQNLMSELLQDSDKIMFLYKNTVNMLCNKAEQSWFASLIKNSISLQALAH